MLSTTLFVLALVRLQVHSETITACLHLLADNCFDGNLVSVFMEPPESSDRRNGMMPVLEDTSWPSSLHHLVNSSKWSLILLSTELPMRSPVEQVNEPDQDTIFIYFRSPAALTRALAVIKTWRMLGPETKVVLLLHASEKNIKGKLDVVWSTLRAINTYALFAGGQSSLVYTLHRERNRVVTNTCSYYFTASPCVLSDAQVLSAARTLPFRLTVLPDGEPFSMVNSLRSDGLCLRSLRAIAQALNLPLVVFLPTIAERPHEPRTSTNEYSGYYKMLDQLEIDIVCGGQPLHLFVFGCCDVLPPFIEDRLVWVIPRRRLIAGWKCLVLEFSLQIWACVAFAWLATASVFCLHHRLWDSALGIARPRGTMQVLLDLYSLTLGNAFTACQDCFRSLLWLVLLYALVVTSSYKSCLTSFQTVPRYERQLGSVEEAADAGFVALLHTSMEFGFKSYFESQEVNGAVQAFLQPTRHGFFNSIEERLELVTNKGGAMALTAASQVDLAVAHGFLDDDGRPLVDTFLFCYTQMFMNMAPAHPLLPALTRQLLYLAEAGLVEHWLDGMQFTATLATAYRATAAVNATARQTGAAKPISLYYLYGLFYLYLVCVCIALACFAVEMLIEKR